MHDQRLALALAALLIAPAVPAVTPADIARGYAEEAKQSAPHFGGFSAARGKTFFESKHGGEWSCASCHTANPVDPGRHAKTGNNSPYRRVSINDLRPGTNSTALPP